MRHSRRKDMENWKRGLIAGATGLSIVLLFKGKRTGGLIFGGIALATLASEYPDEFAEIRKRIPDWVEHGSTFLDVASRIGERLGDLAQRRGSEWVDALLNA
jgi:hypothetical protein